MINEIIQIRLNKALANSGVASRRKCEELIFQGKVTVNRKTIRIPEFRVSLEHDLIEVNGQKITLVKEKLYFMLHKPKGYLCSAKVSRNEKGVLSLFEPIKERLFTIGRLDKDTTGLLLVTNDGDFSQKVIHPSKNIQKEYLAKVDREVTDIHLKTLSKGMILEGDFICPYRVQKVRKGTLKITVLEGKKREVRHLLENCGFEILELKRIRIGGLHLGSLPLGQWRSLSENERKSLFHS
jgi:23S rRNA pseudouridine2605 synthase